MKVRNQTILLAGHGMVDSENVNEKMLLIVFYKNLHVYLLIQVYVIELHLTMNFVP